MDLQIIKVKHHVIRGFQPNKDDHRARACNVLSKQTEKRNMKTIHFFFALVGMAFLMSCGKQQNPESLYYFPNADTTLVGVKNGKGDIIIPAVHPTLNSTEINYFNDFAKSLKYKPRVFYPENPKLIPEAYYDFENPITGEIIQFIGIAKGAKIEGKPRVSAGEVYNRKGKFLYYIAGYLTDENTKGYRFVRPQDFSEGYTQYVENGKLGYVDGLGNKITKALWEYAEPFNYGYAKVYNGSWTQVPLPGHADYKALTDTANIGYINYKGQRVKPIKKAISNKDYYISAEQYLPYPFTYTPKEQHIVDSLNSIRAINYTNMVDVAYAEGKRENIRFEITCRPKPGFPYYYLQGYWGNSGDSRYTFLVHQRTEHIFHYGSQFFVADEKTPLAEWLSTEIQEVNDRWSEENPSVKLKIDLTKELRYWEHMARKNR